MKIVLQHLFYPTVVLASMLLAFAFIQMLPESYFIIVPLLLLTPLLVLFVFLERYMPYDKKWNLNRGDFKTDLLQTFITLPTAIHLGQFLLTLLLIVPNTWMSKTFHNEFLESNYGFIWAFIIVLILSEFCYYWMHRLSHTVPKLWKLHAIHHSSKRVYWANSGRSHFFDALLSSTAYFIPVLLLNVSDELIVMLLVFSGITGFLEHVNIKFKAGYLNYVFNTAELHRWHHSQLEAESNHNYGKALIVWDLLFGTFLWPKERKVEQVGVQGEKDTQGFKNQFLKPFK